MLSLSSLVFVSLKRSKATFPSAAALLAVGATIYALQLALIRASRRLLAKLLIESHLQIALTAWVLEAFSPDKTPMQSVEVEKESTALTTIQGKKHHDPWLQDLLVECTKHDIGGPAALPGHPMPVGKDLFGDSTLLRHQLADAVESCADESGCVSLPTALVRLRADVNLVSVQFSAGRPIGRRLLCCDHISLHCAIQLKRSGRAI